MTMSATGSMTINLQYVKDFSFENPNAPQIFAPTAKPPVLNLGVNVQTHPLGENAFEVVLMLRLEAKLEDRVAFIAELAYGSVVTVPAMPEEQLKVVLLVEAPRYLFPFARAIVSEAVRDAGFPPIMLNPVDFVALYQSQAGKLAGAVAGTA